MNRNSKPERPRGPKWLTMDRMKPIPAYNQALRPNSFPQVPPFNFQRTVARVFPLEADLGQLERCVDQYLNIASPEIGVFFPAMPYVFLAILDYGKMASNEIDAGWIEQHEFSFFIPLEWYQWHEGRLVFRDYLWVAPFIYVDNELSLQMGREVYGWEKVEAQPVPELNNWLVSNPSSGANLLQVSTRVWPKTLGGRGPEVRPILTIQRGGFPSGMNFPPRIRNIWNPLFSIPRAAVSASSLGSTLVKMLSRRKLLGYRAPSDTRTILRMIRKLASYGQSYISESPYVNILSLKQLRDAGSPELAAYQSLVFSRMEVASLNRVGLLDQLFLATGDLSAGYRIALNSFRSLKIVESLGLVTRDSIDAGDHMAHTLRPVLPFWLDVNLQYNEGHAIAWRSNSRDDRWTGNQAFGPLAPTSAAEGRRPVPATPPRSYRAQHKDETLEDERIADQSRKSLPQFNAALGNSSPAMLGPYDYPNSTVRVLPLLADPKQLDQFVKSYLKIEPPEGTLEKEWGQFEAWGRYVYLMVWNHEIVHSQNSDIGESWANLTVEFAIPVRFLRGKDKLQTVGLVTPYVFTDDSLNAITQREVLGIPSQRADIEASPVAWLNESGPSGSMSLMTLATLVQPGSGQRIDTRTLLKVTADQPLPYNDDVRWRFIASDWLEPLTRELSRKTASQETFGEEQRVLRAMAVELLTDKEPINYFTLKQMRAAEDPLKACFQSLYHYQRQIISVFDLREIESVLHVELNNFFDLPIARTLGLVPKTEGDKGQSNSLVFQPVRPFWMKVHMRETVNDDLFWRSREDHGVLAPNGRGFFCRSLPPYLETGSGVVDDINVVKKVNRSEKKQTDDDLTTLRQNPKKARRQWLLEHGDVDTQCISRKEAKEAVNCTEPQLAIESILSWQWLDWGNPRWYQRKARKPDFCIPSHTIGSRLVLDHLALGDWGDWLYFDTADSRKNLRLKVWKEKISKKEEDW